MKYFSDELKDCNSDLFYEFMTHLKNLSTIDSRRLLVPMQFNALRGWLEEFLWMHDIYIQAKYSLDAVSRTITTTEISVRHKSQMHTGWVHRFENREEAFKQAFIKSFEYLKQNNYESNNTIR